MAVLWDLNLIHGFDFYLIFTFLASTARRIGQYQAAGRLVLAGPGRWPHLLKLVSEHRTLFLTWSTVLPALLALAVSLLQLWASRLVWPEAGRPPHGLTVGIVAQSWLAVLVLLPLGLAMLAVDVYGILVVGEIDQGEMEKYFDQAEYWLKSRTAAVVRVITFGFVNPRRLVHEEVRKALEEVSRLLNVTLWWVVGQVGLRVTFGLALWLTWGLGARG